MDYNRLRKNLITDMMKLKDDNLFIKYEIIFNCSHLMEDVNVFINNGKLSFAYPIMRQVFEYLIIALAFDNKQTTIRDFAKVNNDDKYVFSLKQKIFTKALEDLGKDDNEVFRGIMNGLWKVLCERTHSNFDRLLMQAYEYDEFLNQKETLKLEAIIAYKLTSGLFWMCADYLSGQDNKIDYRIFTGDKPKFNSSIMISKSDLGIVERLIEIPEVRTVFKKRFIKIQEDYREIKPKLDMIALDKGENNG